MAKQFIFTLVGRNEDNVVFFQNVPALTLQAAVAQYAGKGVLFSVYQNRNDASAWAKMQDEPAPAKSK